MQTVQRIRTKGNGTRLVAAEREAGLEAVEARVAMIRALIPLPRVRDRTRQLEVPLATYQQLQTRRAVDEGLFRRILGGLACREYAVCAEAVPEAFGLGRSTVSRRFVRASARRLRELQERSLAGEHWVALLIDGKTFAGDQVVIALGVTLAGRSA